MPSARVAEHTTVPPTMLSNGIEVSVHTCSRTIQRELALVLPGVPLEADADTAFYIIPTSQRAAMDLVQTGPDVAAEKDALLEKVEAYAI